MIKQKIIFVLFLTFFYVSLRAQGPVNQLDVDGKRHGVWLKNYDKTNELRYEGTFEHGKEIGVFKFYTLNNGKSVLSAIKTFNRENSIAEVKFFASTGKLISEGKMNGKLFIDKWVYYHNKSKTIMIEEYYNENGLLNGERKVYYENGQIAESTTYLNGKIEGKSIWYSEQGIKIKDFSYKDDMLNGVSKYYDGDGVLVSEGEYRNDQKHGIWKFYENGILTEEKDFTVRSKNPKKQ